MDFTGAEEYIAYEALMDGYYERVSLADAHDKSENPMFDNKFSKECCDTYCVSYLLGTELRILGDELCL